MTLLGNWTDVSATGRGLNIVRDDGVIAGHFFGYKANTDPVWLICVAQSGLVLETWRTVGVPTADHKFDHTEIAAGKITLTRPDADGLIRVQYVPANDSPISAFDHRFQLASKGPATAAAPIVKPAPAPAPAPVASATKIIIRNQYGHDTAPLPCTGGTMNLPGKFTLEVIQGPLTITDMSVADSKLKFHPKINGLTKGQVLQTGTKVDVVFTCDAGAQPFKSTWHQVTFQVETKELGKIFHLSAQVRDR